MTKALLAKIDQIASLPENWDGYGAASFVPEVIQNAKNEVYIIPLGPEEIDIFPNPNGTISFAWRSDFGDAHVEISKTKIVSTWTILR